MTNLIVPSKKQSPLVALFDQLQLPTPKAKDQFKITYENGLIKASITKDGTVSSAVRRIGIAGFTTYTEYRADTMSKAKRDKLILSLLKEGHRQTEVASMLGVSQSLVSLVARTQG